MLLRLRAGEGGRAIAGKRSTQAPGPSMPLVAGKHVLDRPEIELLQLFGPLDQPAQTIGTRAHREVEQHPRHGGDRNSLPQVPVAE